MEILWKSFNNILWTTDDSAIGRINICGDPDSAIGRKKHKKKSPGATVLDKLTLAHVNLIQLHYFINNADYLDPNICFRNLTFVCGIRSRNNL